METDRLAMKDQGALSSRTLSLTAATIPLPTAFMFNYSRCGKSSDFQLVKQASWPVAARVSHPRRNQLMEIREQNVTQSREQYRLSHTWRDGDEVESE